jgi:hypothetical protein
MSRRKDVFDERRWRNEDVISASRIAAKGTSADVGVVTESPAGANERRPTVSVVITTVDRSSLVDAVKSALSQELVPLEVIVVLDGADTEVVAPVPPDPRVRVPRTGGTSRSRSGSCELRLRLATWWLGALLSVIPAPLVVYRIQPLGATASRPAGGWESARLGLGRSRCRRPP